MKTGRKSSVYLLIVLSIVIMPAFAQDASTGILPYETIGGGTYDSINLANLGINIHATIHSKPGILPFSYKVGVNAPSGVASGYFNQGPVGAYQGPGGVLGYGAGAATVTGSTCSNGVATAVLGAWEVIDSMGNVHPVNNSLLIYTKCPTGNVGTASTIDGSGLTVEVNYSVSPAVITVSDTDGNLSTCYGCSATDPNGNTISASGSTLAGYTYTDSLNQVVMTSTAYAGQVSGPTTYGYYNAQGTTIPASLNFTSLYWGSADCGQETTNGPLAPGITGLTLADGSSLTIGYETAIGITNPKGGPYYTGRFASLTLPTGGQITYTYSGGSNGVNCNGGTPNTLKRTTPDGTWTYIHTPPQGSSSYSTTAVTDPLGNETDYTFQPGSYEVLREMYVGSAAKGTLLETVQTTYNNTPAGECGVQNGGCVTLPITERDTYTTLTSQTVATRNQEFYNGYGLPLQINEYANSTTLLRTTLTAYGTWNSTTGTCNAISDTNVVGRVCYRQVWNETGTPAMVANTRYTYNSYGNLASSSVWTGSQYLTTSYTINIPNGTSATSTSPLGLMSTFGYSCNHLMMSSTSFNVSAGGSNLSTSSVLDCNGAVPTSETDFNGEGPTISYGSDPFYRPTSITDAMNNPTSYVYGSGATYVQTTYPTSVGASNISTNYTDTLGRPYDLQTQDGSAYDTTTTYRKWTSPYVNVQQTMPCSVTASQGTCPSTYSLTTSYDALGREVSVVDANGNQTTYTYFPSTVSGNNVDDVLVSMPGKSKQFEYDALLRLVSVCEISAQTGSSPCGQAKQQNGFLTTYVNNMLGQITTVTEGAQSRAFTYDALSRLVSESNPESGTTNYTWDSATAMCQTGYPGQLVQESDANGNTTCMNYDYFGRLTSSIYSGPNAVANSYVVYDTGTYDGTAMLFAKGQIAEAYTCTVCTPTPTKITDEYFSYDPLGELTDVWEKTPHSPSAYYHTTAAFFPIGLVASLTVPGSTTNLAWLLDSKGRPTSATADNGSVSLATSTVYDPADSPKTINLGLGDQDTYVYDNGERMQNFTFAVGSPSKSVVGALTWNNSNGDLGTLQITDGWNSAATETCNYGYDDMLRINSDACGSVWSQTFSYDRYGNITKSGSLTFAPGYTASTNHYSSLPNATYDNNGNLTDDGTSGCPNSCYTYTYDVNNLVASLVTGSGTNGITRDALGRMVEIANSNGTYTEILYSAIGKTANMSGSSVVSIFAPLPGGADLEVKGTDYLFHHKDWLQTSRFISKRGTRSLFFDAAYAPFGESYSLSGTTDLDFTGQRQDIAAGLYDFEYREYNPNQGRWLSPDLAGAAAVDSTNPQSWNRYAYVLNNPLSTTDPLGLWCVWEDGSYEDGGGEGGAWEDPSSPGNSQGACEAQGGHWDPTNTMTGILTDGSGNVTQINYIDGSQCSSTSCGVGQTLEQFDQALQALQALSTVNVYGGSAPAVDTTTLSPIETMNAPIPVPIIYNDPNGKQNYCQSQANQAAGEDLLPGIMKGNYTPTGQGKLFEYAAHYSLDAAAGSRGLKYAIREATGGQATGVPMSVSSKLLGRASVALLLFSAYTALKAAQDEYKACMAY